MPFPLFFKLTFYLLVLDAFGAVYLTGILDWPGQMGLSLVILASWWAEDIRANIPSYGRVWEIITAVCIVYAVLDVLFLAESFIVAVIHLLLFLQIYKLYNTRTHRDLVDLFILTFLQLVAAATLTVNFGFLLVFSVYMILGTWGLILIHLKRETDLAYPERSRELLAGSGLITPGLLFGTVGVAVLSLVLTLVIFFAVPRIGRTFLPLKVPIGTMMTGFTERVDLGGYGAIQSDPTIVMRVSFPENVGHPELLPDLRWRALAFDRFDGRSWSSRDTGRRLLRRTLNGSFSVAAPRWREPFLTYEVYLEPIGTDMIFTLPRVVSIQGGFTRLAQNFSDGLSLGAPPASLLHYLAVSQPEQLREAERGGKVRPADYPPEIRETYLQLPEVSARLRALAHELTHGGGPPYEIARRIEAYLAANIRYTLERRRPSEGDLLDDFLFERKAGNCEYFAASMAVLLRLTGIPARVVNGFQRGEWNEVGQFFAVRQRDAHSWVEVFFPGAGWVTFDPTPRAAFDQEAFGKSGWLEKSFDALRMRWNRYVIDYNVGDQALFAMNVRRQSLAFRRSFGQGWDLWIPKIQRSARRLWRQYGYALGILMGIVAAGLFLCRKVRIGPLESRWLRHGQTRRTPIFYARMLRLLARRGSPRAPTATAREFASSFADPPEVCSAVGELTALYERVRFGGEILTPGEERRTAALLQSLAARPRSSAPQ